MNKSFFLKKKNRNICFKSLVSSTAIMKCKYDHTLYNNILCILFTKYYLNSNSFQSDNEIIKV